MKSKLSSHVVHMDVMPVDIFFFKLIKNYYWWKAKKRVLIFSKFALFYWAQTIYWNQKMWMVTETRKKRQREISFSHRTNEFVSSDTQIFRIYSSFIIYVMYVFLPDFFYISNFRPHSFIQTNSIQNTNYLSIYFNVLNQCQNKAVLLCY